MVGWHHQLNGHEFQQIRGESEGQTGKPGMLQSMGSQRVGCDSPSEQQPACLSNCRLSIYLSIYHPGIPFIYS